LETLAKGLTDEKLSAKIQTLTEKEAALKNALNPEGTQGASKEKSPYQ
jgi:hypothetical protein